MMIVKIPREGDKEDRRIEEKPYNRDIYARGIIDEEK